MPIRILQQDITALSCDVIVNPTDEHFTGLGGVDGAVHRAAGNRLRKACDRLAPLAAGEVCYTKGYQLKSRYVIHTVGPRWQGGAHNEAALLRGCYTNALALSERLGAKSIAFPLIASGTFGFPKNQVLRIALDAITAYLQNVPNEPDVTLCVLDRGAYSLKEESGLKAFLAGREPQEETGAALPCAASAIQIQADEPENSSAARDLPTGRVLFSRSAFNRAAVEEYEAEDGDVLAFAEDRDFESNCEADLKELSEPLFDAEEAPCERSLPMAAAPRTAELKKQAPPLFAAPGRLKAEMPCESLEDWLKKQDDSFAVTLLKLIDKKGLTDVECYKRANVSRKTFSKINTQKNYKPSKQTVLAFAVGLQLTLEETETLLRSAGFSLSRSYTADKIVEYFIRTGNYDIFEINAALYQYDQVLLGC